MYGRQHTMIERYLPDCVARQFGDTQDRPDDQYVAIFTHTTRESTWVHTILEDEVV